MWLTTLCPIALAIMIGLFLAFTFNRWGPKLGNLLNNLKSNVEEGFEGFQNAFSKEKQEKDQGEDLNE